MCRAMSICLSIHVELTIENPYDDDDDNIKWFTNANYYAMNYCTSEKSKKRFKKKL